MLMAAEMVSKKSLVRRSNVLKHPLGGGCAGVSRELGLAGDGSGMFGMLQAWSHGLCPSVMKRFENECSLTNFIYDQTMQGAIIGMKVKKETGDRLEM